jgi:hypothetical protein
VEYLLVFLSRRGAPSGEPGGMAEMKKFASGLASQGKLRRGAPLIAESAGARVRVRAGKAFVSDGPFAESKEVIGGFWIIEVASREEAIEIARRCPHARHGIVEVHLVRDRYTFVDRGEDTPFLFAFGMEPGLTDPDGEKLREMTAFGEGLVREGKLFETAPLARDVPAARIEARRGKVFATDGPFAEVKEVIGGYGLVRVAGRAEAIELAKRYPHAKWGSVEVREIVFFDPT